MLKQIYSDPFLKSIICCPIGNTIREVQMKTVTLKLPEILEKRLKIFSRKEAISQSEVIRRALLDYFSNGENAKLGSFLDLARDMVGSVEGHPDLSTNTAPLDGCCK